MKNKRPEFFALMRDFNTGKMRKINILLPLWIDILTDRNTIKKRIFRIWKGSVAIPVTTKDTLKLFLETTLKYHYHGDTVYEFIVIDWPYRETLKSWDKDNANLIDINKPEKIDVWAQIEPNLDIITDLVWEYIKDKIK